MHPDENKSHHVNQWNYISYWLAINIYYLTQSVAYLSVGRSGADCIALTSTKLGLPRHFVRATVLVFLVVLCLRIEGLKIKSFVTDRNFDTSSTALSIYI